MWYLQGTIKNAILNFSQNTLSSKPMNMNVTYYPESDSFHSENNETASLF